MSYFKLVYKFFLRVEKPNYFRWNSQNVYRDLHSSSFRLMSILIKVLNRDFSLHRKKSRRKMIKFVIFRVQVKKLRRKMGSYYSRWLVQYGDTKLLTQLIRVFGVTEFESKVEKVYFFPRWLSTTAIEIFKKFKYT